MGIRRAMPTGRTQEARALAMMEWHARETRQLQETPPTPPIVLASQPEVTARSIALECLGKAHGDLVRTGDLEYLDARSYLTQASALVRHLIDAQGPCAFAEEDPEPGDDYGLGTLVYAEIRSGLHEHGFLD